MKKSWQLEMTKLVAPPPDADGFWHYTYVTYHPDTGEWYGGKHTTDKLDDGYLGSGDWVLCHPAKEELIIEVIEFFYSEEHAYAAEAILVNFAVIDADPLCRNKIEGGYGLTREAARRIHVIMSDPEGYRRKLSAAARRRFADPDWVNKWYLLQCASNARLTADPKWRQRVKEAGARNAANPEWLQKMREVGAINAANPEWQRSIREGMARRNTDPEWHRKIREGVARRGADPEWQAKIRAVGARNAANPEWVEKVREGSARRDIRRLEKQLAEWVAMLAEHYTNEANLAAG